MYKIQNIKVLINGIVAYKATSGFIIVKAEGRLFDLLFK